MSLTDEDEWLDRSSFEEEMIILERLKQANWIRIVKSISINLFVPFVNGLMLGFGEILAHQLGLFYGWHASKAFNPRNLPPRPRSWW